MNRETAKIISFIETSDIYKEKFKVTRSKYSNFKDFRNQAGYIVMEILNSEKEFFDYPRKDIEILKIVELYF